LNKNSDFNHLKLKFAQKTQKSQNKSKSQKKKKNQQKQKSRKHVGTCWRQIELQKAMWQLVEDFPWSKK
jgi:hypothetical protein